MAILQAEIKRGFLRCIYRCCTNSGGKLTLINALNAFQDRGYNAIRDGLLITSSAGNGHSSAFDAPAIGKQFSQDQVFALAEEFQATYTAAQQTLALAGSNTPNDAAIFAAMVSADNLQTVTEFMSDFSLLRWNNHF